jgi:phospholipid-translocating ATPase
MFAIIAFNDSFVNIVTITFTSLIMIELLNVYSSVNNYTFQMLLIQLATAAVYFMSIMLLHEYFDVSYMDRDFCVKISAIVLTTWLPLHLLKLLLNWCDPSESARVLEDIR